MIYQTPLDVIKKRLDETNDDFEKFYLLNQMAEEYQKMWKLNKALEISREALKIGQKLLQDSHFKVPKRRRQPFVDRFTVGL